MTLPSATCPLDSIRSTTKPTTSWAFSIHNYFFAKTLDQVRPGGVMAFVTSRYTMDKDIPKCAKYMAQRAELLGASACPTTPSRPTPVRRWCPTSSFPAKAGPSHGHRTGLGASRPDRGRISPSTVLSSTTRKWCWGTGPGKYAIRQTGLPWPYEGIWSWPTQLQIRRAEHRRQPTGGRRAAGPG